LAFLPEEAGNFIWYYDFVLIGPPRVLAGLDLLQHLRHGQMHWQSVVIADPVESVGGQIA
jgi:hypothetical protein